MIALERYFNVVEGYLQSGGPVGSRTLTQSLSENLSAATVRNVMQDLEYLGLLDSPHVSSGRIPTQMGLRLFVDGLLEVDGLAITDREKLDGTLSENPKDISATLDKIGSALSGITQGASLVLSPKQESEIEHVEFVSLAHDRALVVLVFSNGHVENRLFKPPLGQTPSSLKEAANFLNSIMQGRTLVEAKQIIQIEISVRRQELDSLAAELVENGLVFWEAKGERQERLIVRGRANLLESEAEEEELNRIRLLFNDLERKQDIAEFLNLTEQSDGVRIFIGSENKLFSLSGSSLVVSPYMNSDKKVIGAVGVIGPTRLNYGRIVPIVDYTAQLVGKLITDHS
jgi:heat-inducible transcriptional repressor